MGRKKRIIKKNRRRKLNKLSKKIILITVVSLLIAGSLIVLFNNNFFKNESTNKFKEVDIDIEQEKTYSLSLIAVGDNLIHSSVYANALEYGNYETYNFKPMYKYIKDIVSNYDIGYYNQETILGGKELGLSSYPVFNSPYEVGDAMIDAGFNLVSLATNHTMDYGRSAVENSCNYWKDQTDVMTSGSYCSMDDRNAMKINTINDISYTMLNYTYGTNGMPTYNDYYVNVWPTDIDYVGDPLYDTDYINYKEQVKADIEAVRDHVDLLIVAMHWGVEYTHTPTNYEVDMANYLASLGVDIIIGTHPHVIQPVTWIDDTLVIYSLGNFISAQYQNEGTCTYYKCTVGLMTNLTVEKTVRGDKSSIVVKDVENELIYNYYNQSSWRGYTVIPFSNPEIKNYLYDYVNVYNNYKSIVQNLDSNMVVKPYAE